MYYILLFINFQLLFLFLNRGQNIAYTKNMAKFDKKRKLFMKFIVVCLLVIVTAVTAGYGFFAIKTKNAKLDLNKILAACSKIKILSSSGEEINSSSVDTIFNKIPAHTINAFIAKEDKRFYSHSGIDIKRMFGAMKANISSGEYEQGGSTITQQLIKNTHLSPEKTLKRKLDEIKLATMLEKKMTKDEILDSYLSSIYFGNGLVGLGSAAKYYFKKDVQDLTIAESAILSGIISAPSVYNPVASLNLSKQKGKMVLKLMLENKYITQNEYDKAAKDLEVLELAKSVEVGALYTSYASQEALDILGLDTFPSDKDIVIKTYLNPDLQEAMEKEAESVISKAFNTYNTTPDIAQIVLDNITGGIIAFSGSSPYNLLSLKRSPASTIKPLLVYAPAIEYNLISPASYILDESINISGYTPQNATKKTYGYTTVRDNIVRSTNIPAVKILNELGVEKAKSFATNLGIEFTESDNHLALALGGFSEGTGFVDIAGGYMAFSNNGKYIKPRFVKEITIGDICVYKDNPIKTQVMKESTAYLITDLLKSVAEYGTGRRINNLNLPIASKTGTNCVAGINKDGYNVSYTTEHTALAWIGDTTGNSTVKTSNLYNGSTYPTELVKNIFSFLYKDYSPADFIKPTSVKSYPIDADEYNINHNEIMADKYTRHSLYMLYPEDNPPKKRDSFPTFLSFNDSNNDSPFKLVYERMIRKYGGW